MARCPRLLGSRLRPPELLACSVAVSVMAALAGCHVSGCREDDQVCQDLASSSEGSGSTDATDSQTGSSGDQTTSGPTTGESSSSGEVPAVCGDGVVGGDEQCDDGNDATDDDCMPSCELARCGDGFINVGHEECDDADAENDDDCTTKCTLPRCGDGLLHPPSEACDEGKLNSDSFYGGCGSQCQPGPGCGDGVVNGPEDCDDGNDDPHDGCLTGCIEAASCQQILAVVPDAPTGKYRVWPTSLGGAKDVNVFCDMTTDGGGYSFLKVDTQVINASDKGAVAAELLCNNYGMHLLVPRTQAHLKAAYDFAIADNLTPVGGGVIGKGAEYLAILAIFPTAAMATCDGNGLNSDDCPKWRAWDDQRFWVTDVAVPGEPSEEHCLDCSMFYKWNLDGTLKSYTTFPIGEGASSYRFVCDLADKF
jgi:cysteine-rich repeat protein